MKLRFRGQVVARPTRIRFGFVQGYIDRPVERQWELFEHSAIAERVAADHPKVGKRRAILHELEVIAVGYAESLDAELRNGTLHFLKLVIPPETFVFPFSENGVAGWNRPP